MITNKEIKSTLVSLVEIALLLDKYREIKMSPAEYKVINKAHEIIGTIGDDQWISVEDELPECWSQHGRYLSSGYILCYTVDNEYTIGQYVDCPPREGGTNRYFEWSLECLERSTTDDYVTHWMPLPEIPKV